MPLEVTRRIRIHPSGGVQVGGRMIFFLRRIATWESQYLPTFNHAKKSFILSETSLIDDIPIYEDNEAAMHLVKNGKSNSDRTKHIALRHFFVKQYLDDGTFNIVYCPTEDMIADILTKPLQGPQFFKLRALILGHALP